MDHRDLHIFKAVYEERHFGRAGMRVNTVQSNVSTRIRRLEDDLGTALFYRTKQTVTPSPAADILYEYAGRILLLEEELRAKIQDPDRASGPLRLGSMETTAAVRLPGILTRYFDQYPNVDLSLVTGPSEDMREGVVRQDLDLAFVGGETSYKGIVQQPVFEETLSLYASPRWSLEEVLQAAILVFRKGCSYRRHLESFLSGKKIFPRKVIEMGTLDGILGCAASGMGVTMMPQSAVRQHRLADQLVEHPLPEEVAGMVTYLIYRNEKSNYPALAAFVNAMPVPKAA